MLDFISDLSEIMVQAYKEKGINPPNGDTHTLLSRYFNLKDKIIVPKIRNVKVSKELSGKVIEDYYKKCLHHIKNRFKNGKDVSIFLSKKSIKPSQKDLLLYDWGIHHLHLSMPEKGKQFVERSDYLLFLMIDDNNAYFIDVTKHKLPDGTEFSQQELLRIVKDNWPFLLEPYRLKGAISLDRKMTDKDYSEMRQAGSLSLVEIKGEVYGLIGGGITTARTNINHTTKADDIFRVLRNMETTIRENTKNLSSLLSQNGFKQIDSSFKLIVKDETFYVINESTNVKVLESKSLYDSIFR
ncbi:MAG TPA: hypothetical protein VNR61_06945 [Niallia sp.]|jgi:hypothetical protein|nr:hypothetical protein [Niallia sp.]